METHTIITPDETEYCGNCYAPLEAHKDYCTCCEAKLNGLESHVDHNPNHDSDGYFEAPKLK